MVCVDGAQQFVAASCRIVANARVVAGGDALGADLPRGAKRWSNLTWLLQCVHGIGVRPCEIIVHKGADHGQLEFALEIDHVIRDRQVLGNAARVVDIVDRAATVLLGPVGPAIAADGADSRAAW